MTAVAALRALLDLRGSEARSIADWSDTDLPDVPDLLARARDAGWTLHAARLTLRDLGRERLPVIGRADDGAFCVIEAIDAEGIRCRMGAGQAAVRVTADAFVTSWSGVVVSTEPLGTGEHATHGDSGPQRHVPPSPRPGASRTPRLHVVGFAAACLLVVAIAAWLALSSVPTVVEAIGTPHAADDGEAVVASVAGTVTEVLVEDDRIVAAGDVLARITVTTQTPQVVDVADLVEARVMIARADAMLAAVAIGEVPVLPPIADLDPIRRTVEQQHLVARYEEHRGRLAAIDTDLQQRRVERVAAEELVARASDALAGAIKAEAEGRHLYDQGFISRNAANERSVRRIGIERDLERHRTFVDERTRAIESTEARHASARDEFAKTLKVEREDGVALLARLETPLPPRINTETHEVGAPLAGRVQGAGAMAVGQAIERGDRLFSIRPSEGRFEIDVSLDAAAAARVRPGQAARARGPDGEVAMQVAQVSVAATGDAPVRARLRATEMPAAGRDPSAPWTVIIDAGEETRLARLLRGAGRREVRAVPGGVGDRPL